MRRHVTTGATATSEEIEDSTGALERPRRVQFDFLPEAYGELSSLQKRLGAYTKAETVRTALRVLRWLITAIDENKKILLDDGQKVQEVVFPFVPRDEAFATRAPSEIAR